MKKLGFTYQMLLRFSAPVTHHHFTLKCVPKSSHRQEISDLSVQVEPYGFLSRSGDGFGNESLYGACEMAHQSFRVCVAGTVRTGLSHYEMASDVHRLSIYQYSSRNTAPGPALLRYADDLEQRRCKDCGTRRGGNYARALFLMEQLYRDFVYEPGATDIQTTAEEAFVRGRGVCQDYAHILIALCRKNGVPARYVVGMLPGEGLSHAWVEIYDDGMWLGLDPTNNLLVTDQHIKISHGRDYHDCLLNRGIFTGSATQTQEVSVVVRELTE
ncbi:MAG: transglutaminase family protein [Oscillospiraceae bacterium]|nr:transglutaminase family protein [Oscillospiraceae bacterium]